MQSEPVNEAEDQASSDAALPPAPERFYWGSGEQQFADLYLPKGSGPWPVIVMIHGGCWTAAWGLGLQEPLAAALQAEGYAVWNIEYRRLGNGGEWPAMFLDVAAASDFLADLRHAQLDLNRMAVMGHSAGGQLALWLASRKQLHPSSELGSVSALAHHAAVDFRLAVSLAGIPDMTTVACGNELRVIGADSLADGELERRLSESSPLHMLPADCPTLLIAGGRDGLSPPDLSRAYVDAANAAQSVSQLLVLDDADHMFVSSAKMLGQSNLLAHLREALMGAANGAGQE